MWWSTEKSTTGIGLACSTRRRRERESTLALETASSRADVALCQYYRGTLALTKWPRSVNLLAAFVHTHILKCWLEALSVKDWLCTAAYSRGRSKILIRTWWKRPNGSGWEQNGMKKDTETGSFHLNTPAVVSWSNSSSMFAFSRQKGKLECDFVEKGRLSHLSGRYVEPEDMKSLQCRSAGRCRVKRKGFIENIMQQSSGRLQINRKIIVPPQKVKLRLNTLVDCGVTCPRSFALGQSHSITWGNVVVGVIPMDDEMRLRLKWILLASRSIAGLLGNCEEQTNFCYIRVFSHLTWRIMMTNWEPSRTNL